jgi:hypothetical protein
MRSCDDEVVKLWCASLVTRTTQIGWKRDVKLARDRELNSSNGRRGSVRWNDEGRAMKVNVNKHREGMKARFLEKVPDGSQRGEEALRRNGSASSWDAAGIEEKGSQQCWSPCDESEINSLFAVEGLTMIEAKAWRGKYEGVGVEKREVMTRSVQGAEKLTRIRYGNKEEQLKHLRWVEWRESVEVYREERKVGGRRDERKLAEEEDGKNWVCNWM